MVQWWRISLPMQEMQETWVWSLGRVDPWEKEMARNGKFPGGNGTPAFWPGKFHGQRSVTGYSPCGCKESDTTERLSTQSGNKHIFLLCSIILGPDEIIYLLSPGSMYLLLGNKNWKPMKMTYLQGVTGPSIRTLEDPDLPMPNNPKLLCCKFCPVHFLTSKAFIPTSFVLL